MDKGRMKEQGGGRARENERENRGRRGVVSSLIEWDTCCRALRGMNAKRSRLQYVDRSKTGGSRERESEEGARESKGQLESRAKAEKRAAPIGARLALRRVLAGGSYRT
jgi:hypothetical protein